MRGTEYGRAKNEQKLEILQKGRAKQNIVNRFHDLNEIFLGASGGHHGSLKSQSLFLILADMSDIISIIFVLRENVLVS